jgi:hypothetical protein
MKLLLKINKMHVNRKLKRGGGNSVQRASVSNSLLYLQSDKISIGPYGDIFYYLNYFFDNFYSDMY